jgi:hypothetical protein
MLIIGVLDLKQKNSFTKVGDVLSRDSSPARKTTFYHGT